MTETKPPLVVVAERVDKLEGAKVTYRKATVVAINPSQRLIDVNVENAGDLEGIRIPEGSFFPRIGDVGELQQRGSRVAWVANRIAPGAVGEEELAPFVTENITIAMGAANGKNTLFFSPDAPTAATPGKAVGDSWMRRDNITRVITGSWEWDGSTWKPITYGDQVLNSLTVGKLVGGTGTFDLIVGGRLTTSLTGQRTELNPLGLQGFDSAGNLTTHIGGGANLLTGEIRTGQPNTRRIILGASGATGSIRFFAPSNSETGQIASFTGSTGFGTAEGIRMGVPVAGAHSSWNSLIVDDREMVFGSASGMEFMLGGDTNTARSFSVSWAQDKTTALSSAGRPPLLFVSPNATLVYARTSFSTHLRAVDGTTRRAFQVSATSARFDFTLGSQALVVLPHTDDRNSPNLQFISGTNIGGIIKLFAGATTRFEVRNANDSGFLPVWATSFDVQSDEGSKRDIHALPGSSLQKLRGVGPSVWRWRQTTPAATSRPESSSDTPSPPAPPQDDADYVGLIAQHVPAEMQVAGSDGLGVSLSAGLALAIGAINEVADDVDQLKTRALRGATGRATTASNLVASGTRTLTVPLSAAMADADYVALAVIDSTSGVNLGAVTATVTERTTTSVKVQLRNTGLSVLSSVSVQVIALGLDTTEGGTT